MAASSSSHVERKWLTVLRREQKDIYSFGFEIENEPLYVDPIRIVVVYKRHHLHSHHTESRKFNKILRSEDGVSITADSLFSFFFHSSDKMLKDDVVESFFKLLPADVKESPVHYNRTIKGTQIRKTLEQFAFFLSKIEDDHQTDTMVSTSIEKFLVSDAFKMIDKYFKHGWPAELVTNYVNEVVEKLEAIYMEQEPGYQAKIRKTIKSLNTSILRKNDIKYIAENYQEYL